MDDVGRMRRIAGLALLIAGSVALLGASQPLNPLVVRSSKATMPVPPECEEGLSQVPAPRVETAPVSDPEVAPAAIPAPPSGDLQVALADAQRALESSDRASFDAAVASLKAMLSDYPAGDERRVAEDIVQIYDDAARIWTGQFASPFFSESSDAYSVASKYPGYAEAVRRQVFVDRDGNRFYPADETRDFLSRLAAEDLARLGVKVEPGQIARAPRAAAQDDDDVRPLPAVVVRTPEVAVSTPEPVRPSVTTAPPARPATSPTRRPVAQSSAKPSPPKPAPAPSRAPVRAATPPPPDDLPASPPVVATAPAPGKPEPAVSAAPATPEPAPAPAVVETTDTSPVTSTVVTTSPDTAVTTTTAAPVTPSTMPPATTVPATQPAKTRSVLLSVILILIGVGVLVLLFRTAD